MTNEQMRFDFVPAQLAINAMRDNGYKNGAYALAELIDNSIQAGANTVEVLCLESEVQLAQRRRSRVDELAVLDNGGGMDEQTLRAALQFGNGSHLKDRSGIGRFGMGLPSSSISQCKRVDVWSWQEGPDKALYTYLDLNEIAQGTITEVPKPITKAVDLKYREIGASFGSKGTLVVWTQLDRMQWKTGQAILDNSEFLIGRMYRRFISNGDISIRLATFKDGGTKPIIDKSAQANDPMYLMPSTSTPSPFDNTPMFQIYGENPEIKHVVSFNEAEHEIIMRFSYATAEARKPSEGGQVPGRLPHGRHARHNVGVSVMRAGRELELNLSWSIEEQTERWLGIEVEFPPSLDEVFGVSNNKQTARFFDNIDISELADQRGLKESVTELKEVLSEEQDPRGPLIEISETITKNIIQMRRLIEAQTRGTRTRRHDDPGTAEARGTKAVRDRQLEGLKGDSDADENLPEDERKAELAKELENTAGLDPQAAKELAARTIDQGLKFTYESAQLETPAFFSVRSKAGELLITLNTAHPAYEQLFQLLDLDEKGLPEEDGAEVKERLSKASTSFKLLIESWARFEDEQTDGIGKERIQDMRSDWGRIARQFLRPF